jgi:hypothetical protein
MTIYRTPTSGAISWCGLCLAFELPLCLHVNAEFLSPEHRPQDLDRNIVLSHNSIMETFLLPPRAFGILDKLPPQSLELECS